MKNCNKFKKLLAGYIYGDLSRREKRGLERHLDTCESCRKELADLRQTVARVNEAPGPVFPEAGTARMRGRVKARIGEEDRSAAASKRESSGKRFTAGHRWRRRQWSPSWRF